MSRHPQSPCLHGTKQVTPEGKSERKRFKHLCEKPQEPGPGLHLR